MTSKIVTDAGDVYVKTSIAIPEPLHKWAKTNKVSMSGTLNEALQAKMSEK